MTSPTAPARPSRRLRAISLRVKPRLAMAASTRAAVSGRTSGSPFTTRDTVLRLTFALFATSRIVGRRTGPGLPPLPRPGTVARPLEASLGRVDIVVKASNVSPEDGGWTD